MSLGIPKGTRDFSPSVLRKRYYIIECMRRVFEHCGYEPLETPAMEKTSVLTGKYGTEGDKLIFRIMDNGDISDKIPPQTPIADIPSLISEKALRYDLTIPLARYAAMHWGALNLPFKRYQIQPVWRGDRPQRGRYREFYQCDIDIIGSKSLFCEAELLSIYDRVFQVLSIPNIKLRINSRKILSALSARLQQKEREHTLFAIIDKIDKIGKDAALQEIKLLLNNSEQFQLAHSLLHLEGDNLSQLRTLNQLFPHDTMMQEGIRDCEEIIRLCAHFHHLPALDFCLARGIDYYTGLIVEVGTNAVPMGSLGGGGRYNNIGQSLGVEGIDGAGISFGIDRIYDVMDTLQLLPDATTTPLLVFAFMGEAYAIHSFHLAHRLQREGLSCMLFPEDKKLPRQFKYAQQRGATCMAFIGEEEIKENIVSFKHLISGKKGSITLTASSQEYMHYLQSLA